MGEEPKDKLRAIDFGKSADAEGPQVRPAGPEAMRDRPETWGPVDQASDESVPASDPPAIHRCD
jgi:hypothetical protein